MISTEDQAMSYVANRSPGRWPMTQREMDDESALIVMYNSLVVYRRVAAAIEMVRAVAAANPRWTRLITWAIR